MQCKVQRVYCYACKLMLRVESRQYSLYTAYLIPSEFACMLSCAYVWHLHLHLHDVWMLSLCFRRYIFYFPYVFMYDGDNELPHFITYSIRNMRKTTGVLQNNKIKKIMLQNYAKRNNNSILIFLVIWIGLGRTSFLFNNVYSHLKHTIPITIFK